MKKLSLATAVLLMLGTLFVQADTIGGEIAIGGWSHTPGGWLKYPNDLPDEQSRIDFEDDLHLDTKTDLYLRFKLEHPIPVLPNIRFSYQKFDSSGEGKITKEFTYGDYTFKESYSLYSETTLDSYDTTFYYKIVDTTFDLNLGITARYIEGEAKITGKDETLGISIAESHDFQVITPMLYASVRVPLTFLEGLSVGIEGSGISLGGSRLYDLQGDLRYLFSEKLGFEIGYRSQNLKIDDVDNTDADVSIKGFYGGIVWDF